MACPSYDRVEPGAPTYQERLKAAEAIAKHVKRLNVRVQPYFVDKRDEIIAQFPNWANAGVYGAVFEGYSSGKRQKGLIKDGKYCFPLDILVPHFKLIRKECHKYGLRFFSGEERVRYLGDDLTCCGTVGLDGFKPNTFNVEHLAHDVFVSPTEAMKDKTTYPAMRDWKRTADFRKQIKDKSFEELVYQLGENYIGWYQELRERYGDD